MSKILLNSMIHIYSSAYQKRREYYLRFSCSEEHNFFLTDSRMLWADRRIERKEGGRLAVAYR